MLKGKSILFNNPFYYDLQAHKNRILYKINKEKTIKLEVLSYDSDPNVTFSDHKPVIFSYTLFF